MKTLTLLILTFLLSGCIEGHISIDPIVVDIPDPFICEGGWLWDRLGQNVIDPETGAALTCEIPQ